MTDRFRPFIIALVFLAPAGHTLSVDFEKDVRPVLNRLCVECHGPEKQKADIRFDKLDPDLLGGSDADTWHDALDQLNLGEMPPAKAKHQPTREERRIVTTWLNDALKEAAAAKLNAGGRVESRRLTRYEYANTMRDLLGIELDYARELPPEAMSPEGFLNNGAFLEYSPIQIETYLSVARRALDIAIVEGEKPEIHVKTATETDVGRLPRKKDGGAIPVNPEFVLDVPEFSRKGEFKLVIEAGAVIPDGHDIPRMRVMLGCVPGIIHIPRKLVGEVDVTATLEKPQTFTFRGRMEDFPQPGDRKFGNVDFNGMIVLIDFLDADGNEIRHKHRRYSDPVPKPKKGAKPAKELPPPPEEPYLDISINSVRFESPHIASWPPASHTRLLGNAEGSEKERARAALECFLPRAFRRPVEGKEVSRFTSLFQKVRPRANSFEEAMRETFAAVLVSPRFLNLVDTGDQFATANRLSYFLWSTMPDEKLLELASKGKLSNPKVLARETRRMLDDPRSREFATRFADQWFDLGGLDRVAVNPEFFPDFDNGLKTAMRKETHEVLAEILRSDASCLELLDSNWTMANRALATHYGLSTLPRSSAFERVALTPGDRRGGVLGHGSILLSNSNGESSHPIKRAVWILDRLLDDPPAPPPPDVPELDAENPDLAGLTLKEQLAAHREKESCRSCHENLDPWGIALENFDATGRFRTLAPVRIKGKKPPPPGPELDPATQLPNGTELKGAEDLKNYLLTERRPHFAKAVTRRLVSYALGRSLDLSDREAIEALTEGFIKDEFRLRAFIIDLVTSDLFQ